MSGRKGLTGPKVSGLAVLLCLIFALVLLLPGSGAPSGEEPAIQALAAVPERTLTGGDDPTRTAGELLPGEKLDLNRATAEELQKLPGIGEKLSGAIVDWREEHGPFQSAEELLQIPGIGEKRLSAIRDLVTVDPEQ